MDTAGLVLIGLLIVVGLVGIVVPILPGLLLVWGSVLVWALFERSVAGWVLLAVATLVAGGSQAVKYLVPHRRMRDAGVHGRTLVVGAVVAVVGFFVVPVVGLFAGFVLGVYVHERLRLGSHALAWPVSVQAFKAAALSILIELLAALLIAAGWLGVVVLD